MADFYELIQWATDTTLGQTPLVVVVMVGDKETTLTLVWIVEH